MTTTFPFAFDPRFDKLLRLLGVTPANSIVAIDAPDLIVTFGPWKLRTPLSNIRDVRITRDYAWWKAIGARGSFADRGVTFGTNTRRGLCVKFRRPVPGLFGPKGLRHPGMTVTVTDVDGLRQELESRTERTTSS